MPMMVPRAQAPESGLVVALVRQQHDLRARARPFDHLVEPRLEVVEREYVRDHRRRVESAGCQQIAVTVPGVEDLPAVDAVDLAALEDDAVVVVDRHR